MNDVAKANNGHPLKTRFLLRERIGVGGQGEVWRAFDPERNADVALKILHPAPGRSAAAWVALVHEHESASRLEHPGVLQVYPPEREGSTFLLPMELAAGGDLKRLRGAGYLTIVPVLIEVARALAHAHERGVVHRDLKPGNVLFDERGRVKLADFGISGNTLDPGTDAMVRGLSPFTASPEQLRGEPPRPADDIYGLGALAYELLSRYPPHYPHFDAQRVQQEPVPALVPTQQIPPQLANLIAKMLAKDPRRRPANMRDVIDELEASLNDTLTFDFDSEPPEMAANETVPPQERLASAPPAAPPAPEPAPRTLEPIRVRVAPRAQIDGPALWEEVRAAARPREELAPMRSGAPRVLLLLLLLTAAGFAAYRYLPSWLPGTLTSRPAGAPNMAGTVDASARARLQADRILFEQRLSALENRGAAAWGGTDFATLKATAAEAAAAEDAASVTRADRHVLQGGALLNALEQAAPAALAAQLAAGDRAVADGQRRLALEAYGLALRIAPRDEHALEGEARARALPEKPPISAGVPASPAPAAPAPSATPAGASASVPAPPGTDSPSAFGEDRYAKAAGEGYAALGAGRLEEARAAFERARALRPNGREASDGLKRVDAALHAHGFGTLRTRAEDAEADERWDDALSAYSSILRSDASQEFAQAGRDRARARLDLQNSLQALIDRPDLLAASDARSQAATLLQSAQQVSNPGPELRLQMARVAALLPEFERPVRLALVSDGLTQVTVSGVGSFGGFTHRDIDLKPGRYTLIGTRDGYRDVRRDVSISPGQTQTVNVSCYDPL